MAFCRLVFPLLVLGVVSCHELRVPVYVWGDLSTTSIKSNPLKTTTSSAFDAILKKELTEKPKTIVFVEKSLSVEDFSLKNSEGESSFPYLHANLGSSVYLPSVANAVTTLDKFGGPDASHITYTENGLSEEIPSNSEIVFVEFKDAHESESRVDFLARHDSFMKKTVSELQKRNDKVVAIYTANLPSWIIPPKPASHSRVRRAAGTSYPNLNGLLLKAQSIVISNPNESIPLTTFVSADTTFNDTQMTTKMVFENDTSISLNFNHQGGYWFFNSVLLSIAPGEELLPEEDEIYALEGFSYRCSQNVTFSHENNKTITHSISFNNMHVEPLFNTSTGNETFSDSFNCVGYFSVPIWSGLFVVFILLTITFYGIMMMLDIRTMDRFDDPKGKTITINAE